MESESRRKIEVSNEGMIAQEVRISTEYIKLEQLLKLAGIVGSGADAKAVITGGEVMVNGHVELQRGKKLRPGDYVQFEGKKYLVAEE
jgi:ribosome-associated protein